MQVFSFHVRNILEFILLDFLLFNCVYGYKYLQTESRWYSNGHANVYSTKLEDLGENGMKVKSMENWSITISR